MDKRARNLKPLTTDGSIMGPADKVCSCVLHWNHDDCTDQCTHEAPELKLTVQDGPNTPESVRSAARDMLYGGTGEGCDDAAGSEVAQVRRPPEG